VERKNVLFRVKKGVGIVREGEISDGEYAQCRDPYEWSIGLTPTFFSWGSVRGLFTGRVIRTSSTTEYLTMILYRPTTQTRCMTMILRHRVTSGDVLALFDAPTATSV